MSDKRELRLRMNGKESTLKRSSTRVRIFDNILYNHVEYHPERNAVFGFEVSQAIMDQLVELEYPVLSMCIEDDPEAKEWFESRQLRDLYKATGELLVSDIIKPCA